MFTRFYFSRLVCVASFVVLSACGATTGGGGGGVVFNAGTTCQTTMVTDQCGMDSGHAAIVHCVGGSWTVVQACGTAQVCVLKGSPTCVSTGSGGGTDAKTGDDASTGNDAALGDTALADSVLVDIVLAEDTPQADDVAMVVDIVTTPDVPKDVGKDVAKDIVKADVQAPKPTWGECPLTDTACIQSCFPEPCNDAVQACYADSGCLGLQDCEKGCSASPIVMPAQSGTSIPQKSNETQAAYCSRVCQMQAGNTSVALNEVFVVCAIGSCVDCANSASGGLPKSACQSACAIANTCKPAQTTCVADADCLDLYGCVLMATDDTEQQACLDGVPSTAAAKFTAFSTCLTDNAKVCVAP